MSDNIEIRLWQQEHDKALKKVNALEKKLKNDPLMGLCDVHIAFKKLLDDNQGEARHKPAFGRRVSALAKKEKQLKAEADGYDMIKISDELSNAKMHLSTVSTKLATLKWHDKRKNEQRKELPIAAQDWSYKAGEGK